jgi:membrane protease YdiL (CAAX protease family)
MSHRVSESKDELNVAFKAYAQKCRRGVLVAGVTFGVLHNSGGRNWAFAAWASLVGILYGYAFVVTQDLYVAMGAHSLANIASATMWVQKSSRRT